LNKIQDIKNIFKDQTNKNKEESLYRSCGYGVADLNPEDELWAKEIIKGGYILHFRHAEREKWPDVMSYGGMEYWEMLYDSLETKDFKKKYEDIRKNLTYHKAVCLSDRGIEQAKLIGFYIRIAKIKISEVISSPSCRAYETSMLGFGRIDKISNALVHYGPWNENRKNHLDAIKNFLEEVEQKENQNVVISSHNGVIQEYLFDKIEIKIDNYDIEEGGFYVIQKDKKNKIILKYRFKDFYNFSRYLVKRNYKIYSIN